MPNRLGAMFRDSGSFGNGLTVRNSPSDQAGIDVAVVHAWFVSRVNSEPCCAFLNKTIGHAELSPQLAGPHRDDRPEWLSVA
jgi:hypothetical protein